MRVGISRALALFVVTGVAASILGPAAAGQSTPIKKPARPAPVPFTVEFKYTHVQTLANGATITRESTRKQARDSQGRYFQAETFTSEYGDRTPRTMANVDDPVAGTQMRWDSGRKKVTVTQFPPEEERHGCWRSESGQFTNNFPPVRLATASAPSDSITKAASPAAVPSPQVKLPKPVQEDLGDTTIQGVEAHGKRWTTTTPTGEIGNDQPLVRTSELWNAEGLGLVIRMLINDPRNGTDDVEPVDLLQGEPDPALFQPPEGYEVVTEAMVPCKK